MSGTETEFDESRCRRFIEATRGRETPELLLRAMELVPTGHALELGCGAGDDAMTLLQRGYRVTVVDEKQSAIDAVNERVTAKELRTRLAVHHLPFERFEFEVRSYDLIQARFSIPFVAPAAFPTVWTGVLRGLRAGGVFTGQLFGPRDSFATDPDRDRIIAFSRSEVDVLLRELTVHHLEEVEKDGHTAIGTPKHWHVFHILAQRPE
jgi:tellurite methyltransferase